MGVPAPPNYTLSHPKNTIDWRPYDSVSGRLGRVGGLTDATTTVADLICLTAESESTRRASE